MADNWEHVNFTYTDWFLKYFDTLKRKNFELFPGVTVTNPEKFYSNLKEELLLIEPSVRMRTGVLQNTIKRIYEINMAMMEEEE